MLAFYKPPATGASSPEKRIIPPGVPYLTKVNGKLVMAREKREKTVKGVDLLGEAFGTKTDKVTKKRSQSTPPQSLLIGGVSYVAQEPQPPMSAPVPQVPFPPGPMMMPPYGYQQPVLTYAAPLNAPAPTPQQFEHLRGIDAHYHNYAAQQHPRISSLDSNENSSVVTSGKTTITITKHICANCGRIRSKKYHQDHPIVSGQTPAPEFCGRCQRDVSCTDSGSDTDRRKKKSKTKPREKKERGKKDHKAGLPKKGHVSSMLTLLKHTSISSDQDSSEVGRRRRSKKKGHSNVATSQRVIPVVEEFSDEDEEEERGRGRLGRKFKPDGIYEAAIRSHVRLRPSSSVSSTKRKESRTARERSRTPERPVASYRIVEAPRVVSRQKSPASVHKHVKLPASPEDDHGERRSVQDVEWNLQEEPGCNIQIKREKEKTVPVNYPDDASNGSSLNPKRFVEIHHDRRSNRSPSRKTSRNEQEENHPLPRRSNPATHEQSAPQPTNRGDHIDNNDLSSNVSREPRRRRRRETKSPPSSHAPWGPPHVLRPQNDEQVIVVTEKYIYRPKKEVEEIRRRQEEIDEETIQQEYADRAILGDQYEVRNISVQDDAESYYNGDWARSRSQGSAFRVPMPRRGYRREGHDDSSLAESELPYRTDPNVPPRVPSPPSPPRAYQQNVSREDWNWQGASSDHPPYPLSSGSGSGRSTQPVNAYNGGNANNSHYNRTKENMPSTSEYLPPRERNTSRTETMRSRPEEAFNREHQGRSISRTETVGSQDTLRSRPNEYQEHRRYSPNGHLRYPDEVIYESREQGSRGNSRDTTRGFREVNIHEHQEQRNYSPREQVGQSNNPIYERHEQRHFTPHEPSRHQSPEVASRVEVQHRSQSRGRPAFVREATDGGTEKALVISSTRLETHTNTSRDQNSEHGGEKHVQFREPISERNYRNTWTPSENSDIAACMNGWGDSDIDVPSGGGGWMSSAGQPDPGDRFQMYGSEFSGDEHVQFREPERYRSNNCYSPDGSDIAACMDGWGGSEVNYTRGGGWMRSAGPSDHGIRT